MTKQPSKAAKAVDNAKQKLAEASSDVAAQAKTTARHAVKDAKSAAVEKADAAKTAAADEVSGVATALRTAANDMRNGSPQERTIGQLASGLADASDAIRDKDLGQMVGSVTNFARRNPVLFLGGAALVGFAAARFAKASQPDVLDAPRHGAPQNGDMVAHTQHLGGSDAQS